jgi:hypothetical protein
MLVTACSLPFTHTSSTTTIAFTSGDPQPPKLNMRVGDHVIIRLRSRNHAEQLFPPKSSNDQILAPEQFTGAADPPPSAQDQISEEFGARKEGTATIMGGAVPSGLNLTVMIGSS